MKKRLNLILVLLFTSVSQQVFADEGAILHHENCIACHAAMTGGDGSVLYTRKDHKTTSAEALSKQINRCQTSLGLNWSEQQINAVHLYLNKKYYNF